MEGEEDFYKKFRFGGINQFIDSCFPRRNWIIFFEIIERFFEVLWICQGSLFDEGIYSIIDFSDNSNR